MFIVGTSNTFLHTSYVLGCSGFLGCLLLWNGAIQTMTLDSLQSMDVPDAIRKVISKQWGTIQSIRSTVSAQQQMWILSIVPSSTEAFAVSPPISSSDSAAAQKAVTVTASTTIVVRRWLSGRSWWNLNQSDDVRRLAWNEIDAYRKAREYLPHLNIPRVWYFQENEEVGKGINDTPTIARFTIDAQKPPQPLIWATLEYIPSLERSSLLQQMIPIRHEFGFDEPHLRWGRLPILKCLPYANILLHDVIIPLHERCRSSPSSWETKGYRYRDMFQLYQHTYESQFHSLVMDETRSASPRLYRAVLNLQSALLFLEQTAKCHRLLPTITQNVTDHLPCVLCHMDLQPQNILFGGTPNDHDKRHEEGDNDDDDHSQESLPPILSVVDWEEGAWADPRFELILLCRKVMANRSQADTVWGWYQERTGQHLGSIEPWLQLETVHSITSLLIQILNMSGVASGANGRNPWDTVNDIWGKIEREFQRLVWAGLKLPDDV